MLANITESELTLLRYLHVHSGGSGERISLDPRPIVRSLRMSMEEFARSAASLAALGLAGVRNFRPDSNDVPSPRCSAIWLTRSGEDFLKRMPAAPPRPTTQSADA